MPTFGPYELIRRLGAGGMGEVFLARLTRHGTFEKLVVIKRLLPQISRDDAFQRLFQHEAALAALLSHQNIVQIFDFGQVDGQLFICMEFVEGLDIATLIAGGPLPVGVALTILIEAARGLDYAHRKTQPDGSPLGLVHRDVTTRNLLISLEGEVKWIDFGLARALKRDGRDSLVAGTLAYMSPEQAEGRALDARSDLFSLGVIAYELFTGQRPWPIVSRASDHAQQCVISPVKAPQSLRPDLPPALDQVILKLLAPHPADRFQSARLLLDALGAPLLPTPAPPQRLADLVRALTAARAHQPVALASGASLGMVTAPASQPLGRAESLQRRSPLAPEPAPPKDSEPQTAIQAVQASEEALPELPSQVSFVSPVSSVVSVATPTAPISAVTPALPTEAVERLVVGPRKAHKGKQLAPLTPPKGPPPLSPWAGKALWLVLGVLLGVVGIVVGVSFALKQGFRSDPAEVVPPSTPAQPLTTNEVLTSWSLSIQSQPSGARVWLDDLEVGTTPLVYDGLEGFKRVRLRVEAENYEIYEDFIQLGPEGGVADRTVELVPKPSGLQLNISPQGAFLEVLAQAKGEVLVAKRAVVLAEPPVLIRGKGSVWVVVSHPQFAPWQQEVLLSPGQLTTLDVTLDVSLATVRFQSSDKLRVHLKAADGGLVVGVCEVPCALSGLMPGPYVVEIEDPTGERPIATTRLSLESGADVTLPVRLSAVGGNTKRGVRLAAIGGQFERDGRVTKSTIFGDGGGVIELASASGGLHAVIRLDPAEGETNRFLLSVRSKPWARFQVNGKAVDQLTYYPLPAGNYEVRLLPEGKNPPGGVIGFKLGVAPKGPR